MRILYIQSSVVPPPLDRKIDRFFLLSSDLEGDVLQPVWFETPEQVEAAFGPGSYPVYTAGRFRYHWFLARRRGGIAGRLDIFWFYIRKGLEVFRERRYQCIVVYSHMTTALIAGILKLITRTKLIVEIVTAPELAYLTESPQPSLRKRAMHLYSDLCLHISTLIGNRAHFLFPNQLAAYPLLRSARNSVFHEFVPVSSIDRFSGEGASEPYVLLVGAPWYLKGADLLVEVFQRIAPDFPELKLKILGHYPDRGELDKLIGDSPRIQIIKAVKHIESLRIIAGAMVMVLPSRCEGLPRVLIEGMAAGLPLLGSDVGGIPTLIREGENGFVFSRNDSTSLEARLRQVLSDPHLRRKMGDCGYQLAHTELTESAYVQGFARMVEVTVANEK